MVGRFDFTDDGLNISYNTFLVTTLLLPRPILRENHFHVKRDVP